MQTRKESRHIHYTKHHPGFAYAMSLGSRVYSLILIPFLIIAVLFIALWLLGKPLVFDANALSPSIVLSAVFLSFMRLAIAYVIAFVIAVPLALSVTHNEIMGRIFLPFFDVLQSMPVLAFFPVFVAFFVHSGFLNIAAIFILVLTMVWSIVFNIIGGLRVIPAEIKSAAQVFNVKGGKYLSWVLLPAVVPYLVIGSILAWASGWNILIVAEVLHTYIPNGSSAQDLLGIGNLLVKASATGQYGTFIYLLVILTVIIGLMNFLVWQKLLHYAERFRFE